MRVRDDNVIVPGSPRGRNGQTAIEYLIIVGVVAALVLVGFRTFVPYVRDQSNEYYRAFLGGYYGPPPVVDSSF